MDGTFSAREDSPLRPSLGHKVSFFEEKTRFSGMGVPPRRAAACTSGERGSDGACARYRENGAPNRPIWLQLLLLRAYGTTRPAILARFVAAAAAFAPPIPENLTQQVTFWWFPGGGCHFPSFGHFWGTIAGTARAVSIRSTFGTKIFFDRTAVSSRRSSTEEYQNDFFSEVCSLSRVQSAHARSTPWGQLQHQT